MFKAFSSGWFRKADKPVPSSEDTPSTFTVLGRGDAQLYCVSMTDDAEEFVDIEYRKLSYAEVASMSKNKQQTSKVPMATPKASRVNKNQFEVLAEAEDDDLTSHLAPEKMKSNNYFSKNKVYKEADKTRKKRGKYVLPVRY